MSNKEWKVNLRIELWEKNPVCFLCKKIIPDYYDCTLEHVVPRSLGGRDHRRNLSISHYTCNQKRGNIRCKLVLETLPSWKEGTLKKSTKKMTKVSNPWVPDEKDDFKILVRAWKIKLRQQYLSGVLREKARI